MEWNAILGRNKIIQKQQDIIGQYSPKLVA
jgi:hypothetical protein